MPRNPRKKFFPDEDTEREAREKKLRKLEEELHREWKDKPPAQDVSEESTEEEPTEEDEPEEDQ